MSHFESHSFDHNGHLNVLVYALQWPDAPIKIDQTHLGVRSPWFMFLTTRPNVPLELTGRHSASVWLIPVSTHSWPNMSGRAWPDAPPRLIDPSCSLSLWCLTGRASPASDRTRRCARSQHVGRTNRTCPIQRLVSPLTSVSIHDDLEKISTSVIVENMHFTSMKSAEPISTPQTPQPSQMC
jgi:hypothetical protein